MEVDRTGAREAEGSGLLSRPAGDRRVGSNPTPSASEPDRFSGASGQREVGLTGNEGRRSGSDHPAAQDRGPVTMAMAAKFEANGQYALADIARKYAVDRPRWWHRFTRRSK